jgi:rSAM/selenodomain-associated transferase 1
VFRRINYSNNTRILDEGAGKLSGFQVTRPDSGIPLFLFAKAPIAGKVKTRLQPHCNAQQAADIAKILLEAAVQKCVAAWPGVVKLSVWLDREDDFLQSIARRYCLEIVFQNEGDLGAKMHNTFEEHGYPAAIMGCDAPHVLTSSLTQAYAMLHQEKNVIAPSEDGGYYFIGLSQACSGLFEHIVWGAENVYTDTQANAKKNGIEHFSLPSLNDVDTWQDVLSVAQLLPRLDAYIKDNQLLV